MIGSIAFTYDNMDPALTNILFNPGFPALYNSLVRYELVDAKTWQHKIVGDLAESWEQPDPQTYVFKLKQGIKFHDGSEFNAEVAAWNILRYRDHPKSTRKSFYVRFESAEVVDKNTLRIRTKKPEPAALAVLAWDQSRTFMASKAAMDKLGEDGFARNPVGTGPFKFKQWITDDRLILERNPDYFEMGADGKSLPYLDGFVSRFNPDPTVAVQDMRAGSVHVLEYLPSKGAATIKADSNLAIWEKPWAGQIYFLVGLNKDADPFTDVKVRQAALYGIDREGMAKALGFGIAFAHPYPWWGPGTLGYDESITNYKYNPAKVKELLTAAGRPDGISFDLNVINREPENTIAEFVQQMWGAVGIKAKINKLERLAWIDVQKAKKFQAAFSRASFNGLIDPSLLESNLKCDGTGNFFNLCDPELDKLVDQGSAEFDPKKRHEIYKKALQVLQDQAYEGSGYAEPLMTAYRKEVQGLAFHYFTLDLRKMWLK